MKNFISISLLALVATCAFSQQNKLVQTSLSAAITSNQTQFAVASATGISAPTGNAPGSAIYVVDFGQTRGEAMKVVAVSGTTITVRRDGPGKSAAHVSGAMVLTATSPNWFYSSDPTGSCVTASTFVTPWLNIQSGLQWLCSSVTLTWVPGFQNYVAPLAPTTLVSSAASTVAPSGPLFHMDGTAAVTGFTPTTAAGAAGIPLGYNGGELCIIPDAAFTITAANNLAAASTAVAGKPLCFLYDPKAAKPFLPSY